MPEWTASHAVMCVAHPGDHVRPGRLVDRLSDSPELFGGVEVADVIIKYFDACYRDVVGNPFRPVAFAPAWRTSTAVSLARQMYESREFAAMPILADALQDAECEVADVLDHCRGPGPHVRGCWVVDGVLGLS